MLYASDINRCMLRTKNNYVEDVKHSVWTKNNYLEDVQQMYNIFQVEFCCLQHAVKLSQSDFITCCGQQKFII